MAWTVARSSIFDESLAECSRTFRDLPEKLEKFVQLKADNPLTAPKFGKHDRRMVGELAGFHHCHLRDDAVLIYALVNRTIQLVYIVPHAEIEGKRLKQTAKRLHSMRELAAA